MEYEEACITFFFNAMVVLGTGTGFLPEMRGAPAGMGEGDGEADGEDAAPVGVLLREVAGEDGGDEIMHSFCSIVSRFCICFAGS